MSLKAIELQVALPRTQTAGKIQDQLQQRGQVVQNHLSAQQEKTDEQKRKQVSEMEQTVKKRLNNDDETKENHQGSTQSRAKSNKTDETKEENYAQHPYKGNYVDYSG